MENLKASEETSSLSDLFRRPNTAFRPVTCETAIQPWLVKASGRSGRKNVRRGNSGISAHGRVRPKNKT